jgi:hypothetical protein
MAKIYAFPKTLGMCADKLYELRERRFAAQKATDAIEAEEKAFKEHLINLLPKSKASGVAGKLVRVTIIKKVAPQVEDWAKVYKYVSKYNRWDLLQRRLAIEPITELWEAGKKIPGVEQFSYLTISMNKL